MITKKPWFGAKKYGWGWGFPKTWQGWVVLSVYVIFLVLDFLKRDSVSHSGSDTLYNFIPDLIIVTVIFIIIVALTGEKPRWRWGGK